METIRIATTILVLSVLALGASAARAQDEGTPSYRLVEGTEARFVIDELRIGRRITVVGVTPEVTGNVLLDPIRTRNTEVGVITIDARDLTTNESLRNRALRRQILQSNRDEYRFITFETTAIEGMPALVRVGDTFELRIRGNLQIRDVVREEVFDTTVEVVSETEVRGLASTTVLHRDYDLSIPRVPFINRVFDEVILELEFTAVLVE